VARYEFEQFDDSQRTTREEMANIAAVAWLSVHPEVDVTARDLNKTTQQLITELFHTGGRRQRVTLSAHAVSVLDGIGVRPDQFAPVRTHAKGADMPMRYGIVLGRLADELAPLAAAVQLARIPVTNAAAELGAAAGIDRRQLRGFVVGHVRPHAQRVHARVGAGDTVDGYLRLILADVDRLAAGVVESARAKNARPKRLDSDAAVRVRDYAGAHLPALTAYAGMRFGQEGDDIVGAAMLKIATQFRNDHTLDIGVAYGKAVVDSVATDYYVAQRKRRDHEMCDAEAMERVAVTAAVHEVDDADALVRLVMSATATLGDAGDDHTARETLLQFFLVDPRDRDPRRARLAARALGLMSSHRSGAFQAELRAVAGTLGADHATSARVAALAVAALRAQVSQSGR
jgi:hypothetical protein